MVFTPSKEQQAIFDAVLNTQDNIAVRALAGTGKTTTAIELARVLPPKESKLFCAYNKPIVEELVIRLEGTGMEANTFHALGFAALKKKLGMYRISPDKTKYKQIIEAWAEGNTVLMEAIDAAVQEIKDPHERDKEAKNLLKDTIKMADSLTNFLRLKLVEWDAKEKLQELVWHYRLDDEVIDQQIVNLVIDAVPSIMAVAEKHLHEGKLDFTDMIYWVVRWNVRVRQYQRVFVDESQDLSPMQRAMVKKFISENGGRIVLVGDPNQAINAFAGADSDSFQLSVDMFQAKILPMTFTRRCAQIVTHHAQELVSEFTCLPEAPRGKIVWIDEGRLVGVAQPGDLVLCRVKAPLIGACIDLIGADKAATIIGSDIAKSIVKTIERVAQRKGYTFETILDHLKGFEEQQVAKFVKKEDEAGAEAVRDQCAAVRVVIERANAPDYDNLITYVEKLFSDTENGKGLIKLATVHKSKGLEAERVFILAPEKLPLNFPNQTEEAAQQENNLDYVARTRATRVLVYLTNKKFLKDNTMPAYAQTTFDDLTWEEMPEIIQPELPAPAPTAPPDPTPAKPEPALPAAKLTLGSPEHCARAKQDAIAWATDLLAKGFVILDYETTGLEGEPVQIAIIDHTGKALMNTLVRPETYKIEAKAQAIHGISAEMVKNAPAFVHLYLELFNLLRNKTVVTYNVQFDRTVTNLTCGLYGLEGIPGIDWQCAMLKYADYRGEWNDYFQSFSWQKLELAAGREGVVIEGEAHDALTDVKMTLNLIRVMAGVYQKPEPKPELPKLTGDLVVDLAAQNTPHQIKVKPIVVPNGQKQDRLAELIASLNLQETQTLIAVLEAHRAALQREGRVTA